MYIPINSVKLDDVKSPEDSTLDELHISYIDQDTKKRFWGHVDIRGPDECWNWIGGYKYDKYGSFTFKYKTYASHRFAFFVGKGTIRPFDLVLHTCDNPSCCNPNHLYIGTPKDNVMDMIKRNRYNPTKNLKFISGVNAHRCKFTAEQVIEIRELLKTKTQVEIARLYGVFQSTISQIKRGITYTDVI